MASGKRSLTMAHCKSEFWAITCEGGKIYSQVVLQKFHITMAALDPGVNPTSSVVSVFVDTSKGSQYLLCSLKPDSILQVNLDLYFDKGEKVTFSVKGHGVIHLSGYHIYNDKEDTKSSIKALDNDTKVFSAIEKFIGAEKSKLGKKAVSKDTDEEDDTDDDEEEIDDDDEEDEEESEDEKQGKKGAQEKTTLNKKLQNPQSNLKTLHNTGSEVSSKRQWNASSEDDSEDSSEEDNDNKKSVSWESPEKKKMKKDVFAPGKSNFSTPRFAESKKGESKTSQLNSEELNSSLGRTPMPKKATPSVQTPNDITTSKKKKKKQSLSNLNESQSSDTSNALNVSLNKIKFANKLPGGLEFEDIRDGNGPVAKKGKLIHVYYTGKLENNTVFDSVQAGSKPFSFRLGFNEVIKGWDTGILGMKVGGKRKLKIPPHLGYKNQRMGKIPPGSTLYFVVELKAVS